MIGERLEEARKRKGISIREAAEATKIRGEFLMSMEDNSFDIDLPKIYIRGFLKNYARFLNLDPDKILTDFDAQQLGRAHALANDDGTTPQRDSYGRMEIGHEEDEEEDDEDAATSDGSAFKTEASAQPPRRGGPPPPTLEPEGTRRDEEAWADNKTLYLKVGVVFGGLLVLALILVLLIRLVSSDEPPEINPELAGTNNNNQVEPAETSPDPQQNTGSGNETQDDNAVSEGTITLRASDTVTVIVEQTADRERIFSGTLNAGESISRERSGPVSIRFTNGSALTVEAGNETFRPNQSGVGRTVIE